MFVKAATKVALENCGTVSYLERQSNDPTPFPETWWWPLVALRLVKEPKLIFDHLQTQNYYIVLLVFRSSHFFQKLFALIQ